MDSRLDLPECRNNSWRGLLEADPALQSSPLFFFPLFRHERHGHERIEEEEEEEVEEDEKKEKRRKENADDGFKGQFGKSDSRMFYIPGVLSTVEIF